MSSGVYAITHTPTGQQYIGGSRNIELRFGSHLSKLRHHDHPCPKFQAVYDLDGEHALSLSIIEPHPTKADWVHAERRIVEERKPTLNQSIVVNGKWTKPRGRDREYRSRMASEVWARKTPAERQWISEMMRKAHLRRRKRVAGCK